MTKITPTEAIKLCGKARQTIYDAMDSGALSFEQVNPRKRLIDVAELERWNGGLSNPDKAQTSEDVFGRQHQTSEPDNDLTASEIAALKERVKILSDERQREREQLLEQIDDLKQTLKQAHEHQTRLTALLTDQRQETDKTQALQQTRLIEELRQRQFRLEAELRSRNRGFFARWLGSRGQEEETANPAGEDSGPAGSRDLMPDLHNPIDQPVRDAGFHVNLERRDPAMNMARFYAVRIERTLFGHWAVIRQWGRIGTKGNARSIWFEDLEAALAERDSRAQRKRGRGYLPARTCALSDCA